MAFPGLHAVVYYNEAGEPLGWDYPSVDPPEPDDHYDDDRDEEPTCTSCGQFIPDYDSECKWCGWDNSKE